MTEMYDGLTKNADFFFVNNKNIFKSLIYIMNNFIKSSLVS